MQRTLILTVTAVLLLLLLTSRSFGLNGSEVLPCDSSGTPLEMRPLEPDQTPSYECLTAPDPDSVSPRRVSLLLQSPELPNGCEATSLAMLLNWAGWDGNRYRVADPIYGWETIDPADFWASFDAMGRRAVAVRPA